MRIGSVFFPDYKADWFYPVELGQIFQGRYQVLAKFGFGSSSTSWLARDLEARRYVALKVYVQTSWVFRELPAYHQITTRAGDRSHQARRNIRSLHDSFEIQSPDGSHVVLVLEPAQMSLRDMMTVLRPEGFDEDMVKGAIIELLKALDFLHTLTKTVHTDIHPGNMLLGAYDNDIFKELEEAESNFPVPRKRVSDTRTIYLSRVMRIKEGPMLLSDYDEARIGPGPHGGDIMPLEYRSPETLLYVGWSYPVDIWSVGLTAWDLLGNKRLFTTRGTDGGVYDSDHLAEIMAALGPPSPQFLAKNPERRADFWDDQGKWLGLAPFCEGRTLESLETKLVDKTGFLKFIRRALTWLSEERVTARELLQDPWLA
ncbi:kinase-like protein [Aspergillus germanicus]